MDHGSEKDAPANQVFSLTEVGDQALSAKLKNLSLCLSDPEWREQCLGRVSDKFPSLVTYLAQLLAHDVSRSALIDTSFNLSSDSSVSRPTDLRTNDLLLHTIYGEGPQLDSHIYESDTQRAARFKLTISGVDILPAFGIGHTENMPLRDMHPLLGDERNADTPMLMGIAVEFMRFHNSQVDLTQEGDRQMRFTVARARTIFTWHNILQSDVLPRLCPRETEDDGRLKTPQDFTHGLLRAFHSLPLDSYFIKSPTSQPDSLETLMSSIATSPRITDVNEWRRAVRKALFTWKVNWKVDLGLLSQGPDLMNETCITPSFAEKFGPTHIFERDVKSAKKMGVSGIGEYPSLMSAADALLKRLSMRFDTLPLPAAAQVPLSFGFLAEAHLSASKDGALGPYGASVFKSAVMKQIREFEEKMTKDFGKLRVREWKKGLPETFESMMRN